MTRFGYGIDEDLDYIVLINGEEEEENQSWIGLTQTMKKVFVT